VHTELGRSQVEVQRCTLSWGLRLRSSSAHWRKAEAEEEEDEEEEEEDNSSDKI